MKLGSEGFIVYEEQKGAVNKKKSEAFPASIN